MKVRVLNGKFKTVLKAVQEDPNAQKPAPHSRNGPFNAIKMVSGM